MRNCHEYCGMGKHCRFDDGEEGRNPEECRMYDVLEKVVVDSRITGRRKTEGTHVNTGMNNKNMKGEQK